MLSFRRLLYQNRTHGPEFFLIENFTKIVRRESDGIIARDLRTVHTYRDLKHARFLRCGRQPEVSFPFNLNSHNHIYIASIFSPLELVKNLEDTTVLEREMFSSFRLPSASRKRSCFSSLVLIRR